MYGRPVELTNCRTVPCSGVGAGGGVIKAVVTDLQLDGVWASGRFCGVVSFTRPRLDLASCLTSSSVSNSMAVRAAVKCLRHFAL